ncbi:MAG TPA: hypothetical protein VNO21_04525 [Polyangiaceae bacterium]|nr:hypothetical protein [Polyangiaceae bacterium]
MLYDFGLVTADIAGETPDVDQGSADGRWVGHGHARVALTSVAVASIA